MRKIWLVPILLVVIAALAYGGFWYFFPLQASQISDRLKLREEGVVSVESDGLNGYLHDTCSKDPKKECTCIALIHGLGDSAMTWKKLLIWPENGWIHPVKLYAFDLPGSGASPPPKYLVDYRVRKQAERMRRALAPLCKQWIVVGNSLGGWIGAWLALDWPDAVTRLLMLDSAGIKLASNSEARKAFEEPTVETLKEFQRRAYFLGRELPDHVWRAVVSRMKASNSRQVIEAQTPEDYLDGRIGALRVPTMIFWGESDRILPLEVGQQFKAMLPRAIWHSVPQCGHMPQKECPVDVIKAVSSMMNYGGA